MMYSKKEIIRVGPKAEHLRRRSVYHVLFRVMSKKVKALVFGYMLTKTTHDRRKKIRNFTI